jgi:hypothetical protein
MRYIKTFESFLFEFKQVGPLYHFTNFDSLEGIFEEDKMEPSAMYDYISFTRNPLLKLHKRNVRIDFDGDEMSNRFHFEPFLYDPEKDPNFYDPEHVGYAERRQLYGDEREERIKSHEIHGIKKFITSIEIIPGKEENFQERLSKLENENPHIEFRIVNSFTTRAMFLRHAA